MDPNDELLFAAFEAIVAELPRRKRARAVKRLLKITTARADAARPIRGDGHAEAAFARNAAKVRERAPDLFTRLA